jgi:glycerophosphoryl diester phosphodiesterase
MKKSALMAVGVNLITSANAFAQPNFDFHQPIQPPRKVQVMVHRGMSCAAPENSAVAIEMCAQDYCEWAEIDVRLSKDGKHVIVHNDTVDATTNGTGRVADLTLQELKKLDAGSWFAKRFASNRLLTLTEALELAKGKINLVLDCKSVHPKLLVEEVIAAGMERQVIVFGSPEDVTELQSAAMSKVACMSKFRPKSMTFDEFVKRLNPAAVEIDVDEITPTLCQQFHAMGIKVQVKALGKDWDSPVFWRNAIDSRADWLQTDDPVGFLFFSARQTGLEFPVKIAAHRGANRYAPENTLPAIHVAARLGLDYAEIDIRTTLDGNLVLMHDSTLNRTTDRNGTVRETTYAETQNLHAGNWFGPLFRETRVPSFDDSLRTLGERMSVYLDAKDVDATELVAAIRKFHLEERHVVYQSVEYCKRIHELEPKVRTLPPLKHREQLNAVAAIHPYGVDAAWSILSGEMIEDCHKRGIQVFSDAIGRNETVDQYRKAIGWGIDCIQTDHPLRVLRAIEELAALNVKSTK